MSVDGRPGSQRGGETRRRPGEVRMQKRVIEYAGVPMGIAVPEAGQFRFIAVKFPVIDLDNRRYHSVDDLQRAIFAHLGGKPRYAA